MKKFLSLLLIGIIICTAVGCNGENNLLGIWVYDSAEDPDPDMLEVKIEFKKDTFLMTNSSTEDYEGQMECVYTITDDTLLVTELRILVNGEVMESNSEFMEIPYSLNGKKLVLDFTEAGLGKIIFKRK